MLKLWEFLKKVWNFIKKFWWAILAGIAFIIGFMIRPHPKSFEIQHLEKEREKLQEEEEDLKKEQERLEKEAEEIEKKNYFNDPDSAAKFLNDTLRKRHK